MTQTTDKNLFINETKFLSVSMTTQKVAQVDVILR